MAWGAIAEKAVEPESQGAYGLVTNPDIVFVTYDQSDRKFCHLTCEGDALVRTKIRTAHRLAREELRLLIARARVVVIATCRESTVDRSAAQKQEMIAAILAHAASKQIVLICSDEHQAMQKHIAFARKKVSLIVTPLRSAVAESFRECFPHTTIISRVDDVPDFYPYLAEQIHKLL